MQFFNIFPLEKSTFITFLLIFKTAVYEQPEI